MADLFQQSSIPAFQDALIAGLSARDAFASTEVVVGPPSPGVAQVSSWVALLDVVGDEKWAAMGRLSKEENYSQKVYVSVLTRDGEGTSQLGRDIAFTLRRDIAEYLRENPTVSNSVWQAQLQGDCRFLPRLGISVPDESGHPVVDLTWREAAVYFDILVKYRMLHV